MYSFKIGLSFFIAAFSHLVAAFLSIQSALMFWDTWGDMGVVILRLNTIPLFIYGLILTIFGLYYAIRDYREITIEKLLIILRTLGCLSIMNAPFCLIGGNLFSVFLLIISGLFMVYFSYRDEDYFNSSSFTFDLVIFILFLFLTLFIRYAYMLIIDFITRHGRRLYYSTLH